jgi:hypothetical protein
MPNKAENVGLVNAKVTRNHGIPTSAELKSWILRPWLFEYKPAI